MLLPKARAEGDWYAVTYEDDLDDGETVTGTPEVRILRYGTDGAPGYEDATTEFLADGEAGLQPAYDPAVETPDGSTKAGIRFYLAPAADATHQAVGAPYRVEAIYHTTGDRHPVVEDLAGNLPRLRIE